MDAIQNLRSDSLSILFLLEIFEAVLERMAAGRAVDCDHLNRLLELLRMKCRSHEEKLERVFFPALWKTSTGRFWKAPLIRKCSGGAQFFRMARIIDGTTRWFSCKGE